jgi:hypothetical protein
VSKLSFARDPRRVRPRTANRPDSRDDIPQGVLFSEVGQTGWGRRRDLGDYKGNKSEKNFDHLNEKFTDQEGVT